MSSTKRYPLFAAHARRARDNNLGAARTARANGYSAAHIQCAVWAAKAAHREFMELRRIESELPGLWSASDLAGGCADAQDEMQRGYDPYNSVDRFKRERDARNEREAYEQLSMLLRRQAG